MTDRATLQSIARLVPPGSRVLDLGCGDGALLDHLQRERGCTGYGVEIDDENVLACVKRGVNVIQLNLDQGLAIFRDDEFDVVLQIDTLQHLRNAEVMLRGVGRRGGEIGVCGTCMDARGIADAELTDTTHRSSLEELTNWVQWADRTLVF